MSGHPGGRQAVIDPGWRGMARALTAGTSLSPSLE
jgi:hypothetical protein